MDFFKQIINQINSIWQNLDSKQRLTLGAGVVVFFVALILLVALTTRQEYSLLYSNLSLESAGQIITKLKEMNIPYKLKNGGTAIFIPSSQVHEVRINLAMAGIPSGGEVGFEIFDNKDFFGMTNFMEKINYQRALQGELARTIESMDEVVRARVHLVLPDKSPFVGVEESKPRASVALKLKPGSYLNRAQIMGIAHLVLGSVEGLELNDVVIVNQNGEILFKGEDNLLPSLSSDQIELKRKVEEYLTGKVYRLLSSVLGPEKAVVTVNATLNFDQITRTEESYDPEGKVIQREIRREETSENSSEIVGGAPGVKTNLGQTPSLNLNTPGKQVKEESTVEYAVNRKIQQIVEGVGNLERISVAVAVDGIYKTGQGGEKEYIPRSKEEMDKIVLLVKQAVGYNEARGDRVTVTNIPFDVTSLREEENLFWEHPFFWDIVKVASRYIMGAILLVIVFLFLKKAIKIFTFSSEKRKVSEKLPEEKVFEDRDWVREHIFQLADKNPKRVAEIIKFWINNHGRD